MPLKVSSDTCQEKWRLPSLLFLLSILFSSHSSAQSSSLNSLNIMDIQQDEQGFIWIASHSGLTRYSGKDSVNFSSSNKTWPLPFTWINNTHFLKNKKILLATETHGLWVFDSLTGQASAVNINIHRKSIYHVIEHLGHYYLNAPEKLYQVDPKNSQAVLLAEELNIRSLEKTNKNLYVASNKGLFQLVDNKLTLLIDDSITAMSSNEHSVIASTKDKLFIISDSGIQKSISTTHIIHAIAPENGKDSFFTVNNNGEIKRYSNESLAEQPHLYSNTSTERPRKMLHDNSGVLWLVSSVGIRQLTPALTRNHRKVFDVAINAISLASLNNELIIGSYGGGLSALSKTHPILESHINSSFTKQAKVINDIVAYGDDLYISTFDGLWRYSSKNNSVNRVDFPENNALLIDITIKNDLLYLATDSTGFLIYDIANNRLIKHINQEMLSAREVIDILPIENNKIWIANTIGIDIYDVHNDSITFIDVPGQNKVVSLIQYKNKVFVATKGDGMFVYNKQGELLSHFAQNLNFSRINLIEQTIWASGQPGLYKIDPTNYQISLVPNTEQYNFSDEPIKHNGAVFIGHYSGVLEIPQHKNETFHPKVLISKTTVSGQAHLLNKSIEVESANDVISLEIASLDFRPGQEKQYKYQINNGRWNTINGNQLTLTGLASGLYDIEIMATNSLGQWSNNKAFTEINVAYPWYWTPQIRVIYAVTILCFVFISFWLLYLRAKSIGNIHQLLQSDIKSRGKKALNVSRSIALALEYIQEQEFDKTNIVLKQSIEELNSSNMTKEPDSLYGNSLVIALAFLSEFVHKKYHINVVNHNDIKEENLSYELQSDIYKIIYEAITSAILNSNGRNFKITLQEFKDKIWLTISDDSHSFANFNSKINFDMAMYYIRQIALKYKASVNTFDEQDKGSQLVISIPLMNIS